MSYKSRAIWDFFICFFSGFFGVQSFINGQVGMGLLYLFTFGLLGFGWIVDRQHLFLFNDGRYAYQLIERMINGPPAKVS